MFFESNSSCTVAPRPFGNTAPLGPQIWSLLFGGTATGASGNQNSSPLESSTSPAFGASTSSFGTSSTTAFGSSSLPFSGRPTQDNHNQSAGGATSLFGQSSANPFSSPSGPFGATSSTSSLFSTTDSSTFGTSKSLFGTSMGQGTTNPFDPNPNFSPSLLFSQLSTPSLPPSSSPFGQNTSTFGQDTSSFGQSAPNPPSSDSFRYLFQSAPSFGHTNELGMDSGGGGIGKCELKVTEAIALIVGASVFNQSLCGTFLPLFCERAEVPRTIKHSLLCVLEGIS